MTRHDPTASNPTAPPLHETVAEIKFSEWTAGSVLRHPGFVNLRDDKRPEEITRDS